MSISDALRTAIANELNDRTNPYGLDPMAIPFHPNDVIGIEFVWDEGETIDNEDYGLSPRLPSMELRVTTKPLPAVSAGIGSRPTPGRPQQWHTVNAGLAINELFQAIMREGL